MRISTDQLGELLHHDKLGRFGPIQTMQVNRDLGFARLLKDANQGWVDSNATEEHFPITEKGVREVGLEFYEFDRVVTGTEAAEQIEADGYQCEGLPEGLVFAAANPIAQLRRPIVLLASRWQLSDGSVLVPYLDGGDGDQRYLYLYNLIDEFVPDYQFLVSRKLPQT